MATTQNHINARDLQIGDVVLVEEDQAFFVKERDDAKGYLILQAVGEKGRWAARRLVEFWRDQSYVLTSSPEGC
jgi:hypothetical protein